MSHHRTALVLRAGACTLLGATAAAATSPYWPAAITTAYTAAFLAWCGRREAACARRERVMAQRAEMAARPVPCCLLWQMSEGGDHGADCHLRPELVEGISRGWAALDAACCLASWESRGAQHDTTHCTRKGQTA
ncbi:hypothetical protein GKQ77_01820 [Streptomyces sp. BG9H]|uniref:Uncharacterized protein n=1 Tax=Streptomyces anatolicus TaxID=2675858 RepID=A0ABS6YGV5_9ACTN|nr:hypothetical protein [Streptomyces anatolicus]MBW5420309.1 hypothetical protein [Streptomyces anatolicus]